MSDAFIPIPCLSDNFAWLKEDIVVDPSEAEPVLKALAGRPLRAIWCTHHHMDHVGGVAELRQKFPQVEVLGSAYDLAQGRIPHQTRGLSEGDTVGAYRILAVPGHTLGAIAYVGEGNVLTGDTLFTAGCGRMFEGDAEMMFASLQKLKALDPNARLFVGHEYTASNLRFAAHVEPDNAAVRARKPTALGATIADELATNPFLRAKDAAEFARLRTQKDTFK